MKPRFSGRHGRPVGVWGLLFLCLVVNSFSSAQDFKKVIEVVGELEDSVNVRLRQEADERRMETAKLQNDVAELRKLLLETRGQLAAKDSALAKAAAKPPAPVPSYPNIKVGALVQVQGIGSQEKTTAAQDQNPDYKPHWARQIQLRRMRILVGGNVSAQTLFFFESDSPLLGEVTGSGVKGIKMSMFVQDAYIQHTFVPEFSIIAGLQLVGITRNGLQSAATLMPVNYGAYTFMPSTPTDSYVGRDAGFAARGFLVDERLEYRLGMYSGRSFNLYTPLRYTARVNYNLMDREKGYFYTGSTLGKGSILAFGGGMDMETSFRGYAVDGFMDMPVFDLGSLTASASISFYDGGGESADSSYFTQNVPKQTIIFAEVGYLFREIGLQPVVKYEAQTVNEDVAKHAGAATPEALDLSNTLKSGSRFGVGLNYFVNGHNFNAKLMYERVFRNRLGTGGKAENVNTAEIHFQLQYFTF